MGDPAQSTRCTVIAITLSIALGITACSGEPAMPSAFDDMPPDHIGCLVAYGDDRFEVGPLGPSDSETVEPDSLSSIRIGRTAVSLIVNAERERDSTVATVDLADLGPNGGLIVVWGLQDRGNPGLEVRCWTGSDEA